MSTDPDIRREEQIASEQEEHWDLWTERSLARLWEQYGETLPWSDAVPENEKTISEEKEDV